MTGPPEQNRFALIAPDSHQIGRTMRPTPTAGRRRAGGGRPGPAVARRLLVVLVVLAATWPSVTSTVRATGSAGTWKTAADLATGRMGHTATRLTNGQVLVVGGDSEFPVGAQPTETAELFDPSGECEPDCTGKWLHTGGLNSARAYHSATLLDPPLCHEAVPDPDYPCGTVLVVGGTQQLLLGPLPSTAELYDPDSGTWQSCPVSAPSAACPASPDIDHGRGSTATLLLDGRVLVISDGAELYEPRTGTWTAAPTLNVTTVFYETATRLTDGKVLVTGYGSAEVYDPESDTWTLTGDMNVARTEHLATLLTDGTVLVSGGRPNGVRIPLQSAETFDPATKQWEPTGTLAVAQFAHSATRLAGGAVLVAGGYGVNSQRTSVTQLYDPVERTWLPAAPMPEVRDGHTATLLVDGQVLVAAGRTATTRTSARLYQSAEAPPVATVQAITPTSGPISGGTRVTITGTGLGPTTAVRFGDETATAVPTVLSDSEVTAVSPRREEAGTIDVRVVNGGGVSAPVPAARFTYLGPEGLWTPAGNFQARTVGPGFTPDGGGSNGIGRTTTLLKNGKVLVAGGGYINSFHVNGIADLYDPATGRWEATGSMAADHQDHTATLLHDGRVLVAGGDFARTAAERYDPTAEIWVPTGSMATPRVNHTATLLNDGTVLVVAGDSAGSAERYDPQAGAGAGAWSLAAPSGVDRVHHTATLLSDGKVLVVGGCPRGASTSGCSGSPMASAQLFDPDTDTWSSAGAMASPRFSHTATRLSDGTVLVAGGCSEAGDPTRCATATGRTEIYDPTSGSWRPAGRLIDARAGHTATPTGDGRILMIGGAGFLATAELFDPLAGTSVPAAHLLSGRTGHTAVILPAGPVAVCGANCGRVLIAAGTGRDASSPGGVGLTSAELYAPQPRVTSVRPALGPTAGGTAVVIDGYGLGGATEVGFGEFLATGLVSDPDSPSTRLFAVSPKHVAGPVDVVVVAKPHPDFPTLESAPGPGSLFAYFVPDRPLDLVATAVSDNDIRLDFIAPDDPPATRYVIKQSVSPVDTDAAFDAATTLCGGVCDLAAGDRVTVTIGGLLPGTTYHFALRAMRPGGDLGPRSTSVSATTSGIAPTPLPPLDVGGCPAVGDIAVGSVAYPAGYSLVGVPAGTVVSSQSPLYGWLNLGAGGGYSARAGKDPTEAGRGYWAYFSCPKLLGPLAAGESSVRLPLGGYRASMVGNPSGTDAVSVSGHDFIARWDGSLNSGAGGYRVSGHRQVETLGVGQGVWAFSYSDTVIRLDK